ncbi:MAG: PIN/TRAM domain-containing protein [Ktedonobacterales bacterium]
MTGRNIFRFVGLLIALGVGLAAFFNLNDAATTKNTKFSFEVNIGIAAAIFVVVLAIMLFLIPVLYHLAREQIRRAEVSDFIASTIGLFVGLGIAALCSIFLSQIAFMHLGQWLPLLDAIFWAYAGIAIAVLRKDDFARFFGSALAAGRARRLTLREDRDRDGEDHEERDHEDHGRLRDRLAGRKNSRASDRILVDTSAIIDGRIADISETGFIFGSLVVPRFVLEELQHIADSADSMRRQRGRRGLEILQRLQKDPAVTVEITDADAEAIHEVDAKLVKLARQWHCPIITNDFNLNRVAELQGVKVLNINELAHAVKPILLPGEEMTIKIMQDGKEINQGVGYLDDGTMIVVEGGRSYIGSTVDVTVTRVLQTVAGRMIFAHPKQQPAHDAAPARRTGTA